MRLSSTHRATFVYLRRSYLDPSSRFTIIVSSSDVAGYTRIMMLKRKCRRMDMDSNNSNLATDFIIRSRVREGGWGPQTKVLSHGKYVEYKSCQINKINVVPITVIFERQEILCFRQREIFCGRMESNWTMVLQSIYEYKKSHFSLVLHDSRLLFARSGRDLGSLWNWLWLDLQKGHNSIMLNKLFCQPFAEISICCFERFIVRNVKHLSCYKKLLIIL